MLKETTNNTEFDNTINRINILTEDDAKSLLRIIYGLVDTAMTGNGGDKAKLEVVDKISNIYKRIPDLNKSRKKSNRNLISRSAYKIYIITSRNVPKQKFGRTTKAGKHCELPRKS